MPLYLENLQKTQEITRAINKFSKAAGYENRLLVYISNKQPENDIKKAIIASKRI